ncbi:MAG: DUF1460 domain-containing protein [Deltaproteobacteria bacterium HGW-Deltaproteobacteria-19]|nr:MAG: DUF1460 domain-containing protein [Deltaproteobacteria bacterium HGW-Deltaproteobacteria-19]
MPGTDLIFTPEDRRILRRILTAGRHGAGSADGGELTARLGLLFLGAPYEASTLEGRKGSREPLVISLQAFDCFTFVESVTALALTVRAGKTSPEAFAGILERLRYRRGIRGDYASRLHYFTDWLGDNKRLGILRDVTRELGGRALPKPIRYMSDHPGSYPPLADGTQRAEVRRAERNLTRRVRHFLPTDSIREAELLIREGDMIGVTAAAEGLDVIHAGLAVRRDGRIHLLHASRPAGGVVVTEEPLHRYVAGRNDATGIVAGRLRLPQKSLPAS